MSADQSERTIFTEVEIAQRIKTIARHIAERPNRPQIAVPILAGAFVFAADLLRALSREGLQLATEFIWLRSYGSSEHAGELQVLRGPGDVVCGRNVLLIDGVLDHGRTMAKAKRLLEEAGAAEIVSVVAVVKSVAQPRFIPDYALFSAGSEFLYGYGMDAAGHGRELPDIRIRT
jgi:hypoxanthine phosphoribosyltransferase